MEFGFGRRMRIIRAVIYGRSLQCTFASGQGRQDIIALRRTGIMQDNWQGNWHR